MMKKDINDPKILRFLIDRFEKEKRLQRNWFLKNKDLLQESFQFRGEEKGYTESDVAKQAIINELPAVTRHHIESAPHRYVKPIPYAGLLTTKDIVKKKTEEGDANVEEQLLKLGDPKPNFDPEDPTRIMRPVDEETKNIIFEKSANTYLEKRNNLPRDEKFFAPECTYWDYGWESKKDLTPPVHGRKRIMYESSMSRGRYGPDPKHYSCPQLSTFSKCLSE